MQNVFETVLHQMLFFCAHEVKLFLLCWWKVLRLVFLSSDSVSVSGGVRGGLHHQRSHPAGENRLLPGSHSAPGSRGSTLQETNS